MQRLKVLDIIFAVVGELCTDVLVDPQLENVEYELRYDLVGAGEDLLDDGVVLTAKRNDSLEDIFATNVAGLEES